MSSSPAIAVESRRESSRGSAGARSITVDQYVKTLIWTVAGVGACALAYAIEKYVFRDLLAVITAVEYRMFKNPAELAMRLFGLPHFIIGLAFMLSSRRMKGVRSWAHLAALGALGAAFCWAFAVFGQDVERDRISPLALLVFYFYFLIHGFRDEAFFYRAYGEMPKEAGPTHDRIMTVLQTLMLGLLLSLALPAYVVFGRLFPEFHHPSLDQLFPASWPYPLWFAVTFLPMVGIAVLAMWRIARLFPDGLAGLWRMHRPILTVFLIATSIILLALFTGPWTFNIVVLMHFVGWYLFGRYSLHKREVAASPSGGASAPASAPASRRVGDIWTWMRTTRSGFTTLHLGLAVVTVIVVAISVYGFGKSGTLEALVGSKSFYYWTIMHVTLSFYPRG